MRKIVLLILVLTSQVFASVDANDFVDPNGSLNTDLLMDYLNNRVEDVTEPEPPVVDPNATPFVIPKIKQWLLKGTPIETPVVVQPIKEEDDALTGMRINWKFEDGQWKPEAMGRGDYSVFVTRKWQLLEMKIHGGFGVKIVDVNTPAEFVITTMSFPTCDTTGPNGQPDGVVNMWDVFCDK